MSRQRSMIQPVERLSPHLAEQTAPMIAALRLNGVEPRWLILTPEGSGARRRARQQTARAHKEYEATVRRENDSRN